MSEFGRAVLVLKDRSFIILADQVVQQQYHLVSFLSIMPRAPSR